MAQVAHPKQYQVFINHRGPDTKTNVASLIYEALVPYGLQVFLDREEIRKGDTARAAIQNAINSASVLIAIFSPDYAGSHWCLDELQWMLDSRRKGKVIITVFCDVQPNEIKDFEQGCYAEALANWSKVGRQEVNDWKKALKLASEIIGHTFKTKESDYGKFLKEIEDIVIKQVKRGPLKVAAHPVGLDQASKDLQDRIQKSRYTKVVVIAGLGGIGKSTLARRIFNDLSRPVFGQPEFSRASYLWNVRETVDLTSLQQQLYRDLLGIDMDITNTNEGKTMLEDSLRGLKILIVFDDVDNGDNIRSVLEIDAVGPGSLIFITSCDKDILVTKKKKETFVYDVQLLEKNDARELFCHHAFPQVAEGYADLVDKFLEFCDGLPLLLEVLGQEFAHKLEIEYWEKHLASFLEEGMPPSVGSSVIEKLKWSTQALEYKQKKMFLDVAYFLVGEDEELAVRVLEGFEEYGKYASDHLKILGKKGLVSFKNDVECHDEIKNQGQDIAIPEGKHLILPAVLPKRRTKIIMHNQLRALAPSIFSQEPPSEYNPLRLSCSNDIEKMLQSQSDSVFCRGICIRKDRSPPQPTNNINIKDVHILVVEHPKDSSWILSRISGNLVWLRWRHSRLTSLPRTISVRNLRVLELGASKDDLEGFFASIDQIPSELSELNIDLNGEGASSSTSSSAQPVDLPHFTKTFVFHFLKCIGSSMKELRKIVLKNLTVPQSLPFDFSELKNLRHLDLSGSTNLTTLPNSISQLTQLQHLALRDCINLSIPMHILGQITTLEHIDFKGCAQLVQLPEGISSQRSLRYLNLLETRLTELALNLEPLDKLEQLIIGSASLKELSCSVENLVQLKELILVKCDSLKELSCSVHLLTLVKCDSLRQIHTPYLERLEIHSSRLTHLPAGIAQLKHLRVLTIYSSPIEEFAFDNNVMYALTDFTLINTSIRDISIPVGACPRLEIVDLSDNLQLRQVQVFQPTLVKLNLDGCLSLEYLRLAELVHLKCLDINGFGCVETLDVENWRSPIKNSAMDMYALTNLTNLTLMHTSIRDISIPVGVCPRLEIVDLSDNLQLRQVQVFQPTLVKLNLDGCLSLESLRLAELVDLKCLDINGCGCVETLDVENWRSMEEIRAERCLNLRMREETWSQLKQLNFFSFSRKFPWDEVVTEERKSSWSMEKAGYEMMFKSFMHKTFQIRLLSRGEYRWKEHRYKHRDKNMGACLMCFLTRDEGELTNCNDFMVRFVYTTATPTEESRANETRWIVMSRHEAILDCCQKIMAYGTVENKKNEESLERVGDDDSGELHHVQQNLESPSC